MGTPIDLNLLRGSDSRSRRRLLTRLGEGLRESGRVELVGLEVDEGLMVAESGPGPRVREALRSSAVSLLALLEDYFGLRDGTLSGLINDDESLLFSEHRGGLSAIHGTCHLVGLGSPLSRSVGSARGVGASQGSRQWVLESGHLLQRLTNDVVGVPHPDSSEPCVVYVARPRASDEIAVLPDFVWPENPPRYDPVRAGDLWGAWR